MVRAEGPRLKPVLGWGLGQGLEGPCSLPKGKGKSNGKSFDAKVAKGAKFREGEQTAAREEAGSCGNGKQEKQGQPQPQKQRGPSLCSG
jgi:hypothetical protein